MTNNVLTQTNDELVEKLEQLPNLYQTCFDLFYKKTNLEREREKTKVSLKKAESELINFIYNTADETRVSTSELEHYILNDEVLISIDWDGEENNITYQTAYSSNDSLKRIIKKLGPNPEPIEQPKEIMRTNDFILRKISPLIRNLIRARPFFRSLDEGDLLNALEVELFIKAKQETLYGQSLTLSPNDTDFNKVVINFANPTIEYFFTEGGSLPRKVNL